MAEEKTMAAAVVRPYDFRSPERLTSATKALLVPAQQKLAEYLTDTLGRELDCPCAVTFDRADERSLDSFLRPEADPVHRLKPVDERGDVFFRIDSALAQAFVDRILGGPGAPREVERPPTDIEAALLGAVAARAAEAVGASWDEEVGATEPFPLDGSARRDVEPSAGVISSFSITLGDEGEGGEPARGTIRFFYDFDDLGDALGFAKAVASENDAPETVTTEHLAKMRLRLTARYRPTPVQIRDLTSLRVGDVLYLDHKLTDEVEIAFDGKTAFYGYPGTVDSSIGVRISRTNDP